MSAHRVTLGRRLAELRRVSFRLRSRIYFSFDMTRTYARRLGVHAADETIIYPSVQFGSEPWLVSVGRKTWLTAGVEFITHDGSVTVVRSGPFDVAEGESINRFGRIVIGENCFIGVHAIILPGVSIGDDCVVGAASVVTRDVAVGTIVAGNPARVVGETAVFAAKVRRESLALPPAFTSEAEKRQVVEAAMRKHL